MRTDEMRFLREDMQRSIDRQDEIKEQIAELKNDREKEREVMLDIHRGLVSTSRSIDRQDEIKEQIKDLKNDREKEREVMTILEGKLDKILDRWTKSGTIS